MKKKIIIPICIVVVILVSFVGFTLFSSREYDPISDYSEKIAEAKSSSMDDMLLKCGNIDYLNLQSSPDKYTGNYLDLFIQITQYVGDGKYMGIETSDSDKIWLIYDVRERGGSFSTGDVVEICGIFTGQVSFSTTDGRDITSPTVVAIYSEQDSSVVNAMLDINSISTPIDPKQIDDVMNLYDKITGLSSDQIGKIRNYSKFEDIISELNDISNEVPYSTAINAAVNQYNLLDNIDGFKLTRIVYGYEDCGDGKYYEFVYMSYNYTDVYGTNTKKESISCRDQDGQGYVFTRGDTDIYDSMHAVMTSDKTECQELNVDFVNYYMSLY